jgi:hypothetical protein
MKNPAPLYIQDRVVVQRTLLALFLVSSAVISAGCFPEFEVGP